MTTAPAPPEDRPKARFRLILLVALVVALLTSAAALGWLLVDRGGEGSGVQADREAVMSQTEQFVLRLNTFGPDQLDDQGHLTEYLDQVTGVITPKFGADFETDGLPIAERLVTEAGYARRAEVFGMGVESLDADSATVIVAAGLTGSYPDPKAPDNDARRVDADEDVLRWEISLVKVDSTWLVDDYTPVTGEDAS